MLLSRVPKAGCIYSEMRNQDIPAIDASSKLYSLKIT